MYFVAVIPAVPPYQRDYTGLPGPSTSDGVINIILFRPSRGAEYCNERFCLSVGLYTRVYLKTHTVDLFHPFCHGSVLLWCCCDMLCIYTSVFVDDAMFSHNWPYGDTTLRQQPRCSVVYRLTPNCMVLVASGVFITGELWGVE